MNLIHRIFRDLTALYEGMDEPYWAEVYRTRRPLLEVKVEQSDLPEYRRELATAYFKTGALLLSGPQYATGILLCEKSFSMLELLAEESEDIGLRYELASSCQKAGMLLSFKRDKEALVMLEKAICLLEELRNQEPYTETVEAKLNQAGKMMLLIQKRQ